MLFRPAQQQPHDYRITTAAAATRVVVFLRLWLAGCRRYLLQSLLMAARRALMTTQRCCQLAHHWCISYAQHNPAANPLAHLFSELHRTRWPQTSHTSCPAPPALLQSAAPTPQPPTPGF
jgi:hypothetical protein